MANHESKDKSTVTLPIKPGEVIKKRIFPNEAIEAFNELIAKKSSSGANYACILQKDIVALMVEKGLKEEDIFANGWLDVEGIFRKAGWDVEYDKPGFNESYDASFTFSSSRKKR